MTSSLNEKIKKLEEHNYTIENYGPYKMNLVAVLQTFDEFCVNSEHYNNPNSLENLLYEPYFEKKGKKGKQNKAISKILFKYDESVKRLSSLKMQKEVAYRPLNKTAYILKGVTIHLGDLSSGHYYTYIRINTKWYKFNDTVVKEVVESEVMDDARGKLNPFSNCYCLFYALESEEVFDGFELP